MRESLEAKAARCVKARPCNIDRCSRVAAYRPVIAIPKLEGVDKTPPSAEIEFVVCEHHARAIDPIQFLSQPVRVHLENALVKFAGRPLVAPVDWNAAKVSFEKILEIVIVEG
jgi:hypothetical protein